MPRTRLQRWLAKWRPLFGRPSYRFDRALVQKLRPQWWPRWRQLKYLKHFMPSLEKRILLLLVGVAVLSTSGWAILFGRRHSTRGPATGGEYSEVMVGEPKFINPLFANINDVDADISSLVYTGLFAYNNNGTVTPALAASYSISSDGRTYTVKLKPDLKWADGTPLTVDDILFTFTAIQNPDIGSPWLSAFQGVTIDKVADDEIQFVLKEAYSPFLHNLTIGILPEHIWGELPPGGLKLAKQNLQPLGSGPWTFSKLTKDSTGLIQNITLTRNKYFFGTAPYFDFVTFKFAADYESMIEALKTQTALAGSFIPANKIKSLGKNFTTYPLQLPQYTALFFNQTRQPFLKSDRLRQALGSGTDKPTLIAEALGGAAAPIDGPFLPGGWSAPAKPNGQSIDLDAANKLLDDGGWTRIQPEEYFKLRQAEAIKMLGLGASTTLSTSKTDASQNSAGSAAEITALIRQEMPPAQTFYRRDKNNTPLRLTITTVDTPEYGRVAAALGKAWARLGIQTSVQTISSKQLARETLKTRDYEILLYGEILGADPDPFPFWHSSQINYPGLNLSLYNSRAADKLLEEARTTLDQEKRTTLYQKFYSLLATDRPALFLYSPTHLFAAQKNIQGISINALVSPPDRYRTLSSWYTKTRWAWKP